MPLEIKINYPIEEQYHSQEMYDYFEDLAETFKVIYTREFPSIRDYHYKELDFTINLTANLSRKCFDFDSIEEKYSYKNHTSTMQKSAVKRFFKTIE